MAGYDFNVNKAIGGYALGAIENAPFEVLDLALSLGPIANRNIGLADGVILTDSDTFQFWWDNKVTAKFQDNVVWATMLMLSWGATRYPTVDNSYVWRLMRWTTRSRPRYLGAMALSHLPYIMAGYIMIFPNDRGSKWIRRAIGIPAELRFTGVN